MKVQILSQQHPAYNAALLADVAALYEGGKLWHDRLDVFLPKKEQESVTSYAERKGRAAYENDMAPIIDLLIGKLFETPAAVSGLPAGWLADVDGRGTSWSTWWREVATNAARDQRAFIWINFPPPAEVPPTDAADEAARGLARPTLVSVPATLAPNWIDDEEGNLDAVMIRDVCTVQATLIEPQKTVYRWTAIDEVGISRWEWTAQQGRASPGPEDDAGQVMNVAHNRPDVPVVRLQFSPGLHIGGKLRDPVVALTGLANDLDWALHRGAHAVMVIATEGGVVPVLGAGAYLNIGSNDAVSFAEPGGACYAALAERIEVRREGVYRVTHQMGASVGTKGAGASGASKDLDWRALEIVLDAYADAVRAAMLATALRVADVWRVAPASIQITGLDGWDAADMQALLTAAQLAVPMVKSETFRREVAKQTAAGLLPDASDEVLSAITKELDDADYSEQPGFAPSSGPLDPNADPAVG